MIKDWKATLTLERGKVGEVITERDLCKTITGEYIPAKASIGRKIRPENVGYVFHPVVKL